MTPVSVVVPLHNGRDVIEDCLRSIPDGVEVLVVDDASTDGSPDFVAERFPGVRILHSDVNRGFGATANLGLRNADGAVRIVLNSDARVSAAAVESLVEAFHDPAVGVAGPRLVFSDGSHQVSAARFPRPASIIAGSFLLNDVFHRVFGRRLPWELGMSRAEHARDQEVDWVMGACIAIRDACFEATDGFDEGYFMYVEETDLCWRARQLGWKIRFVAGAEVVHVGGGSTGDPRRHARQFVESEARFMNRAYGPAVMGRWRFARLLGAAVKIPLLALGSFDQRVRMRLIWQVTAVMAVLASRSDGRTRLRRRRRMKSILASQPLNRMLTFAVKTYVQRTGARPPITNHIPKTGRFFFRLPDGRKILLDSPGDDRITDRIFWRDWSGYEPEMTPLFFRAAVGARTVLDIGSHVGLYTMLASAAEPGATVVAFEPLARTRERLERNLASNGFTRVRVVAAAAGKESGEMPLFRDPDDPVPGEATVRADVGDVKHFAPTTVSVPVVRVDDVLREMDIRNVDLVKIDVEAAEADVLSGMRETLRRDRPVVFCEVLEGYATEEVIQALIEAAGYRAFKLTLDGPLAVERLVPDASFPNHVFVPAETELPAWLAT